MKWMRIERMAKVPAVCIRCGAELDRDDEYYERCPSLGCLCDEGPLEPEDVIEALETIKKLADPLNEVGDRQTLTSCYEVARDVLEGRSGKAVEV
jgi:hypothetical protein